MFRLVAWALDSYEAGFLLIAGSTFLSVVGLLVVRRLIDTSNLVACHEVGSSLLSVVGTLYAVILGLIVVDAMGKFQEAHVVTEGESNALANLVILANRLPTEKRDEIHRKAEAYSDLVIHEEWPMMDHCECSNQAGRAALDLIDAVANFEPVTESQKAIYAESLSATSDLWSNRRSRTGTAIRGIPALEWMVLILGGVITIVFTYFFALERVKVQVAMTTLVSLIISLNVYLVSMFGYPYSGDLKVSSDGFRMAHSKLNAQEQPDGTSHKMAK